MNVRQFSRRRFVGGVTAAVGALSLRPGAELFAQGQTPQFNGSDADYDNFVKLASNENNWGPPDSVMKAMNAAWKYAKLRHPATWLAAGVNLFILLLEPLGRSPDVQRILKAAIRG